jgi:beta-lactamase superfamily II metal-dependent hydrolase
MTDFFELDFLAVETKKSGDAIAIRYQIDGKQYVHVVDGGYQETGQSVVDHVKEYYEGAPSVDHVVLTHPDGDHAGGLRTVLEELEVGTLWMLRPWLYSALLLHRFPAIDSEVKLVRLLREAFPNVVALEEIALRRGIPIAEPFQGARIGAFSVLAPSHQRYLELIARSDCTPDSDAKRSRGLLSSVRKSFAYMASLIRAAWGDEVFSAEEVSAENEMSVVQFARLVDVRILLTADAGREALTEAIDFAPQVGLSLPGVDRFQVPHHGSRRNVTTDLLDQLLGQRLNSPLPRGQERFTAVISSAKEDEAHPRKAVLRAMIHRGAKAIATEGVSIRTGKNAPTRPGWSPVEGMEYPDDQETD